ncbi:MAG: TonB-dependent receptor, partial [Bacteroides sp.]|nr:TonB-dependent receptor [Bacteroides sp.]
MLKIFKLGGVILSLYCGGIQTSFAAGAAGTEVVQQNGTCSGTVKDGTGETIIGASVVVKGSSNGTITDIDGSFSLRNVPRGSIIQISFVGYQPQEVRWTGTPLNIILKEDSKLLDEVVVVGYGTQKKVNVTGAVSMVNADAIEARPVANVSQALQGAIPGLNLTTSSSGGDLNTTMRINIRGTGTIGDGSVDSPLILIDGIEGNMNTLNPNDIESVSVLKDAASASIYGSRAAFGVILITTKSGKAGKVRVNYSGDVRFSTATQVPDMVDSYSFATYFNRASVNAGGSNQFNEETLERIQKFQRGEYTDPTKPEYYGTVANTGNNKWADYTGAFANTDWFKEFYKKNVPSTQHNLSLSGGTEKFNWSVSGSILSQNGLIRHGHDELNRYTMNSKISAELAKWARVEYSTKWMRTDFEKPQYLTGLFFHNIARRWPTCPVIDPNGHWSEGMEIAELEEGGIYREHKDHFTQQVKFTFTPLAGWNIYAEGAMRTQNEKYTRSRIPVYHYYVDNTPFLRDSGYGSKTSVSDERFRQNYYAVNVYSDYTRSFGKHNGKLLLGVNYEHYNQDGMWGSGTDLTTADKPYLSQTQADKKNGDSYWNRATAGYFGRLNYDYDGKYLFEANIRYDGSSRFVADKRWAWFPSFSVGYNIAREDFFEKLTDDISLLKLRASWGQLGNTSSKYDSFWDWYPFYQQQSIASASGGWLINGQKTNIADRPGIVNNSMTWETVETWDIGLDWAAFDNRLTGSFDWYSRTTKDMIGPAPKLGSVLGVDAPKTNNCDMRTTGWELEISWRDRIHDFKYGARLNLSDARSKILTYPNESKNIHTYYNGKYLNEIWGYESEGIAQTDAEMTEWLAKNKPNWGGNWGAGDIKYKNLVDRKDANGKIIDEGVVNSGNNTLDDHGDLKRIGNSTPRYNFGLNLDAEWKGFDFSIFFQGVLKRDWHFGSNDPYFWGAVSNMWQSAAFKEHMDYWTPENTGAYYPKPYFGNIDKNHMTQTRYLQDASYIRCKNIQFGYSLP